jgi:hypothetical protein
MAYQISVSLRLYPNSLFICQRTFPANGNMLLRKIQSTCQLKF